MAAFRPTRAMTLALKRLATSTDSSNLYLAYSTAVALERRNLVRVLGQQTGGKRAFPEYRVALTKPGLELATRLLVSGR